MTTNRKLRSHPKEDKTTIKKIKKVVVKQNKIKPKLIFTEAALPFILEAFNIKIKGKFLVYTATDSKVRDIEGNPIKSNELGVIDKDKNGKMAFIKGDLYSLMNYADGNLNKK